MPHLSNRALRNVQVNEAWTNLVKVWSNPYSQENPNGIVIMGVAENKLMHEEVAEYLTEHMKVTTRMLTYGDGSSGTTGLRKSLSAFINAHFSTHPTQRIHPHQITILSGVGACVDAICFCVAEEGDGVLLVRPAYVGFEGDLEDRAHVIPIWVSVKDHSVTSPDAVNDHEAALLAARNKGVVVKALLLCNPHNPLGRCYSKEVLEAYLRLCSKYNIHLISDEVYAKAVFASNDIPDPLPFTSVLSLDLEKYIDPSLVHVLYGMSKDFSSNGIRIGAVISSSSPNLHAALSTVSKFSWSSSLADHAWTLLLDDAKWTSWYFEEMRRRLRAAYELCTTCLKELKIPYVPASCGPFVWFDLRSYLSSSTFEAERHLSAIFLDNGVWVATGESFKSDVPGWFRITFAMNEKEFVFGVNRLKKALELIRSSVRIPQEEAVPAIPGRVVESVQDQVQVEAIRQSVEKM